MTLSDLALADNSLLSLIIEHQSDIRRNGSTVKRRQALKGLHTAKTVIEHVMKQLTGKESA